MIKRSTLIDAPLERCFDLTRSIEFHERSSSLISARAIGGKTSGLSEPGDETVWSAKFFGVRFSITTRITDFSEGHSFSEAIIKGLPKEFAHEYTFQKEDSCCRLTDSFEFRTPFGFIGSLADALYMRSKMTFLLQVRLNYLKAAAESDEWKKYLVQE